VSRYHNLINHRLSRSVIEIVPPALKPIVSVRIIVDDFTLFPLTFEWPLLTAAYTGRVGI